MELLGTLEIRISGKRGNEQISPDNFDIREIVSVFECVEDILYPAGGKNRPSITYSLEAGSARNVFRTGLQAVVVATALLAKVQETGSLDVLDLKFSQALERIQDEARRKDLSYIFSSSEHQGPILSISASTDFKQSEDLWMDAEVYFYGVLNDAGGKERSNIHLDTKEYGQVKIDASREFLQSIDFNPLYKEFGVRAITKQSVRTGEIDRSQLRVVSIHPYSPRYDEAYIKGLISKASADWKGIDIDQFMSEVRGYEQ